MIMISLSPEAEERLKGEASRQGLRAEEYAIKLIIDHLPPLSEGQSLPDLLEHWRLEDKTMEPTETARRVRELEEFKANMNRNREQMEGPHSRQPFP